jgi:hypothetical protein
MEWFADRDLALNLTKMGYKQGKISRKWNYKIKTYQI